MTPHRRGTSPRLSSTATDTAIESTVHGTTLNPRDRLAAVLVLLFGQQVEDIAQLTWTDITIESDTVTLTLGAVAIELPPPLDELVRDVADHPANQNTASHPHSAWVFPGAVPGRHLDPAHLRNRLRTVFPVRDARLGTLHALALETPIAILAQALGYSPATIERHAVAANAAYGRYVAALRAAK